MLENLRDYPRHFMEIHFQDYSDGIISGANVLVNQHHLTITKGIVKHNGRLYLLEHDHELPYEATGNETVLKIRFKEKEEELDFIGYRTELFLDEKTEIGEDELELSRFKLKKGAKLRSDYQSFEDFATEFNTINLIHTHIAGIGKATIHPKMMRYFADEVMRNGSTDVYDIMMAMMCINNGTVERDGLLHYLANRLETSYQDYSNIQIHRFLVRILNEMMGGNRAKMHLRGNGRQRIIVD